MSVLYKLRSTEQYTTLLTLKSLVKLYKNIKEILPYVCKTDYK